MTLDELAAQYGIGTAYHDFRGELKVFSPATKAALLQAMGVGTGQQVSRRDARASLPTVIVQEQGVPIPLPMELLPDAGTLSWTLVTEEGIAQSGAIEVARRNRTGNDGDDAVTIRPMLLPGPGYHRLVIQCGSDEPIALKLVVAPPQCHEPLALAGGQRLWGITLQLYTLKSLSNWGIGDFGDLLEVIDLAAPLGCSLVGLNPLHALFPSDPLHCSPYSPSSRQFLNPLYISLQRVPEAAECPALQAFLIGEGAAILDRLRAGTTVDYEDVTQLKFRWLRVLHEAFREYAAGSEREHAFRGFVEEGGEALRLHAVFEALGLHLKETCGLTGGWQSWPAEYQDPTSDAVARFTRSHAADIEFHLYLQWLAAGQLGDAQSRARGRGMALGLYGDIAVGVNAGGSETWSNPRLYVTGAAIGAPPDPLALKGQDWGIPPQSPSELVRQGFGPFISLLSSSMKNVGALRLDHVMALYRQWWVPLAFSATEGAYVHYPLADLLRLLCLESHRNHCVVIGEDLGTVPDAVREGMQRHGVAHYKVLLFEKEPDGSFKAPAAYVRRSIAAVTTHDLPTFRGWWEAHDIAIADRLALYPDAASRERVAGERTADRYRLMSALVGAGLWHWQSHEPLPPYSHALMRAVHLYIGLSNAELAVVQIEDLAGMIDPVNVPGTYREYPNWQRRMDRDAASIFSSPEVREMLGALSIARTGRNPNRH